MSAQREQALGRVQILKKRIKELTIRAGSHLASATDEMDLLLSKKDMLDIDFDKIHTLIDSAEKIQKELRKALDEKKQLQDYFGIDD